MDRSSWKSTFGLALAAMVCLMAAPASAGITYNVTNDLGHQNGWSLAGTITVSGVGSWNNSSFNSSNPITAWDLTLSKGGSSSLTWKNEGPSDEVVLFTPGTLTADSSSLKVTGGAFMFGAGSFAQGLECNPAYPRYSAYGSSVTPFSSSTFSPSASGVWTIGTVGSAAVPEIDPAGMGSVLALVTGALGLLERRRLKVA